MSRRSLVFVTLGLGLLGTATAWRLWRGPADAVHEFVGPTMGSSFSVKIDAELLPPERDRVRDVIESRLDEVNRLMSTWDSTSELSRLNRHRSTRPFQASEQLIEVLAMANEVSEHSDGAFDVTVGPIVDAWGFGPGPRRSPPDEAEVAALRTSLGYGHILLDRAAGTVSRTSPETVIDLSAIAKGYGVEHVAAGLTELGLSRFLVEIGGEVRANGTRRDGRAWRVGIEKPDDAARSLYGAIELVDEAIATSGDYRNFHESEGVRYAHIIDPRTGFPIRFRGASVSVVHAHAAMADAWATALIVLGPEAGYDLADGAGIAALFVMGSNGEFRSRASPAFRERHGDVTEVEAR